MRSAANLCSYELLIALITIAAHVFVDQDSAQDDEFAFQVGGAEVYRNRELDTQKRIYPGGVFGAHRSLCWVCRQTLQCIHVKLSMAMFTCAC